MQIYYHTWLEWWPRPVDGRFIFWSTLTSTFDMVCDFSIDRNFGLSKSNIKYPLNNFPIFIEQKKIFHKRFISNEWLSHWKQQHIHFPFGTLNFDLSKTLNPNCHCQLFVFYILAIKGTVPRMTFRFWLEWNVEADDMYFLGWCLPRTPNLMYTNIHRGWNKQSHMLCFVDYFCYHVLSFVMDVSISL